MTLTAHSRPRRRAESHQAFSDSREHAAMASERSMARVLARAQALQVENLVDRSRCRFASALSVAKHAIGQILQRKIGVRLDWRSQPSSS